VKCLSNIRQLTVANQMYVAEHKQYLPFSNWGPGNPTQTQYDNVREGWLYAPPLLSSKADRVQTGSFWPFLKSREVFRCPSHFKEDNGVFTNTQFSDGLTSYLINGAVNGYGRETGFRQIMFLKITKFKSDDVLFWEADERGGASWNDGSSFPDETYDPTSPGSSSGMAKRHGKYASVAYMDGHADYVLHADFRKLAFESQQASQGGPKKNSVWCVPNPPSGNGR
jgi:prepilin-type processing-associated H-X9-DG protein